MSNQKRCPKCLYLRHPNDAARTPPDTCPRCGKVYRKAIRQVELERRDRSFRAHRTLEFTYCKVCREPFSIYASACPHCASQVKSGSRKYLAAGFAFIAILAGFRLLSNSVPREVGGRFDGISDSTFTRCATISEEFEASLKASGAGNPKTLSLQNQWHAECSRKAFRDLAESVQASLPVTPNEWIALNRTGRRG